MRTIDLVATAISNTFRSKTRTILTILAIFVGAFTLTITNGIGTGVNNYISSTVNSFGASNLLITNKPTASSSSGPTKYQSDTVSGGRGARDETVVALTKTDVTKLRGIAGVTSVQPVRAPSVDYIALGSGTKYQLSVGSLITGQKLQLSAGSAPDNSSSALQLVLPKSYVKPLGFAGAKASVGREVTLALTDGAHEQRTVTATVVGVSNAAFTLGSGDGAILNTALDDKLNAVQDIGLPANQQSRYSAARVFVAKGSSSARIKAVQHRIKAAGYTSHTVKQLLGTFTTVINGIVLVLDAFAVLALLAASFGIVNTLLMSVQERTREIGLMKAMGMGSGRVFTLFSLEAAFIGFLGSAIGALVGIGVGTAVSSALSSGPLSDLPGLHLVAFKPLTVALTIVVIMLVAVAAGTLPAWRAARQNPVESLRYE